jgi:hypothetical protein
MDGLRGTVNGKTQKARPRFKRRTWGTLRVILSLSVRKFPRSIEGRLKRFGIVVPGDPATCRSALGDLYLAGDWAGCGYQYL